MKNKEIGATIIILSTIVIAIFSYVIVKNIYKSNENGEKYFSKNSSTEVSINSIDFIDNYIVINTNANKVCVKTTISNPAENSFCWTKVYNDKIKITAFRNKKYYIWLMDDDNNISDYTLYNLKKLN